MQSFGLLHMHQSTRSTVRLAALHHCEHVESYVEWCKENDIDIEHEHVSEPPAEFCSVSTKKIPYPFPTTMKQQHDHHKYGRWQFPTELVPEQSEGLCSHENRWKLGDLVTEEWMITHNVVINKASLMMGKSFHSSISTTTICSSMGFCLGTCRNQNTPLLHAGAYERRSAKDPVLSKS